MVPRPSLHPAKNKESHRHACEHEVATLGNGRFDGDEAAGPSVVSNCSFLMEHVEEGPWNLQGPFSWASLPRWLPKCNVFFPSIIATWPLMLRVSTHFLDGNPAKSLLRRYARFMITVPESGP